MCVTFPSGIVFSDDRLLLDVGGARGDLLRRVERDAARRRREAGLRRMHRVAAAQRSSTMPLTREKGTAGPAADVSGGRSQIAMPASETAARTGIAQRSVPGGAG